MANGGLLGRVELVYKVMKLYVVVNERFSNRGV
jgi:hypothetical protein